MTKSTLLHLRIPFSFYLLPVFLFCISLSHGFTIVGLLLILVALHIFLYPASNGYNSYFDKDEESIGGLEKPPKVSRELYWYSLLFDLIAIALGCLLSWQFALMLFVYGLVSKAYSHPSIRLKKMPYIGWFVAGFFQGYFTFLMVYLGLNNPSLLELMNVEIQLAAILSSLLLWGSYPMTQVYQHKEDGQRGDITISLKLGVLGTFHFTALIFSLATICFAWYFIQYISLQVTLIYVVSMTPILFYFGRWYLLVRKDPHAANFKNTMQLNFVSALMLNIFFLILGISQSL